MLTVMRSTSLKTQKSPPTSPGQKKIVRFADTLGLDLAAVRTIMQEDLPLIPDSAFHHLDLPKDLLSDIRNHISSTAAAVAAANSPKPSPVSSPSSRHRIFNGGGGTGAAPGCQVSGAKPLLAKFALPPFRPMTGDRCYVNGLADSLDRLHLDLDDDLLDECLSAKAPVPVLPPTSAPAAAVLPSILNKKPSVPTEQQALAGALPPWLALYTSSSTPTLVPEFIEPFVQMNFQDRVKAASVSLENCYVSSCTSGSSRAPAAAALAAASSAITSPSAAGAGSPAADPVVSVTTCVRVVNRSFEKEVYCRFTTNEWSTWDEVKGSYIPSSSDSWSDRFSAVFYVGHLNAGQRVKFALRYVTEGKEYWDNNNGSNYSLVCRI